MKTNMILAAGIALAAIGAVSTVNQNQPTQSTPSLAERLNKINADNERVRQHDNKVSQYEVVVLTRQNAAPASATLTGTLTNMRESKFTARAPVVVPLSFRRWASAQRTTQQRLWATSCHSPRRLPTC